MQKKVQKNYSKETFSDKESWLAARGLGGSSASAILNANPYMSIIELYKAIVMPNKVRLENTNEAMNYGVKCEPLIRKLFAYDHSEKYRIHSPKNNEMYRRKDKKYMTATLDGIIYDKATHKKGILEIKTHDIRNKKDLAEWTDKIPENYYIQVLHYLLVMNDFDFAVLTAKLRFFDYYSEDGKKLIKTEIRYYYIDRNDEQTKKDIEYLDKKETEFWENNVLKKQMPKFSINF